MKAVKLILGLVLTAIWTITPVEAEVKLTVWGVSIGPNDKGQNDVFREFEKRNPGVKVQTLSMGSGGMNPQKLMTSIVGGVAPDVIYQDRFTLADWAARGAFMALDPLISRDRSHDPSTPTPEQYFPETWTEASYDKKVYGIPWMADDRILVWNREVFHREAANLRRAGLDPERAPRTWTELLKYSKVLTRFNADGTLERAGFIPNFGNTWFVMFATLNRASMLSPDGKTCTLSSNECQESLTFMKSCYDILGGAQNAEKFASTFRGEERDAFFTGQVAMKIDGDWALAGIARFAPNLDFGSAPPPVPDDRFNMRGRFSDLKIPWASWAGGFAYCIPKGARHQELAWKFIKFVTSTEGRMMEVRQQDLLNRSRGQMTFPRLTAQRETNDLSLKEFMPKNPQLADAVKMHFQLLAHSKVRPVSFASKVIWDESNRATDRALRSGVPVADALKDAESATQAILDEHFHESEYPSADLRLPSILGVLGFALALAIVFSKFKRQPFGPIARREAKWGYIFLFPWILGFIVFSFGPMLASLVLSGTQYNALTEPHWVGLKNFADVAQRDHGLLLKSFYNALYMAGIGVPLGLITGLSLALLLNASVRGIAIFRTLFYLPAVLPGVASILLWMWVLAPDPKLGLLNGIWAGTIGEWFKIAPPGWLYSEEWAKPAIIVMGLGGAGSGVIVWLAGLKGIPKDLYESASIDGANPKQLLWNITLPQLSPLIFYNFVTGIIGALQMFDPVYVSTNGNGFGPNDSLLVPAYQLFVHSFSYFRMGYASALAWVVFAVIASVTGIQFFLAKRFVHYEVSD